MKLLTLTNRFYIASIVFIVLIGGIVAYIILRKSINKQFNAKLIAEKEQLIYELHKFQDIKDSYYLNIGDKITIEALDSITSHEITWLDTTHYDEYQKKDLAYRQIQFSEEVDGQYYLITISKSLLSTDELIANIGEIILMLMLSLIITMILISDGISKTVWQSFHETLAYLKKHDITKPQTQKFRRTRIKEFMELNEVITAMINKSIHDYDMLKEFSENASHEIQTPLAIIKSKSESLMQDEDLSENQITKIKTIYNAANRLSKINHDLTFLTQVENNQFKDIQNINLQEFLNNKLEQFEDLFRLKKITVTKHFKSNPIIAIDDTLCYVLVSNLLGNATKHNIENGTIDITINDYELIIENTGHSIKNGENARDLMLRFRKGSDKQDSSGLGLALVKKICDSYGMKVDYKAKSNIHTISVIFNNILA